MKQLLTKSILPIALFLGIAYLGKCLYMVDGQMDWFCALLVFGLPYGIPYMIFVIPIGGSVAGKTSLLVLNAILGAVLGFFIAAWVLLQALVYPMACIIKRVLCR